MIAVDTSVEFKRKKKLLFWLEKITQTPPKDYQSLYDIKERLKDGQTDNNLNDDEFLKNSRLFINTLVKIDAPPKAQFSISTFFSTQSDEEDITEALNSLEILIFWLKKNYNLPNYGSLLELRRTSFDDSVSQQTEMPQVQKDSSFLKRALTFRNRRHSTSLKALYGFDKEIAEKIEAKRDKMLEWNVLKWIEKVTNVDLGINFDNSIQIYTENLDEAFWNPYELDILRDGQVLCKLANTICPEVIKYNKKEHELAYLENIKEFLKALKVVGAPEGCQFSPEALLKKSDLHSVFVALSTLGDWCDQKHSELELPFYNENSYMERQRRSASLKYSPSKKWAPVATRPSFKRTWKKEKETFTENSQPPCDEDYINPEEVVNHKVYVNQSGKVVYGLDAEVAVKNELKRDPLEEKVILDWIKNVIGEDEYFKYINEKFSGLNSERNFTTIIEDGILFIKLINKSIPKHNHQNRHQEKDGKASASSRRKSLLSNRIYDENALIPNYSKLRNVLAYNENISLYFKAIQEYLNIQNSSLFPLDAIQKGNIQPVIQNIYDVADALRKRSDYTGPLLVTIKRGGKFCTETDSFIPEEESSFQIRREKRLQEMMKEREELLQKKSSAHSFLVSCLANKIGLTNQRKVLFAVVSYTPTSLPLKTANQL